jgi:Kef-type K+ transport system membrane component KefB
MHGDPLAPILLMLMIILAAGKLGGELLERLGQPAVLGELVFGVILGNIVLLNPDWTLFEPLRGEELTLDWAIMIDDLARLGVILLLFEVGLESTVAEMARVGMSSFLAAIAGVIAPFILGFGLSWVLITEVPSTVALQLPGLDVTHIHIFVGATLCATSVGITARVFKDLGKMQTKEAKIILGAAVIDDVFGLIILAIVAGIVSAATTGTEMSSLSILKIATIAIGFLFVAIILGLSVVPRIMRHLARLRTQGIMVTSALLFCFLLSWLADAVGMATIVGAFAAGLILEEVHFREFKETVTLGELVRPISTLFVPIFFVLMGIQVRLETFADLSVLAVAGGLTLAALVGKQVCGLAPVERRLDRWTIGVGMIPRGEVGLIFAGIGKSLGILDDALFSAIVIMVIVTTMVTPPVLKLTMSRWERLTLHKQGG